MNRFCTIAAIIGVALVGTSVAFVLSGVVGTDANARAASRVSATHVASPDAARVDGMYRGYARSYAEPAGVRLADGTYLGFVRTDGRGDENVDVDFVALRHGAIANSQPAVLVDAGLIAHAHFFGPVWQPYRISIQNQTIVSALSADDVLPSRTAQPNTTSQGEIR